MAYDAKDIKSLSFLEGVRQRIQMYLGSDDIEGTYQGLKEIINNSTDEALAGFGSKIEIVVNEKDNSVSVRDFGRGVPFLQKKDGTNVLIDVYTKAHTGGKFSNDNYKNASGLNGVGGSCVCLSSQTFIVKSYRDGTQAEARFTKGANNYYRETKTKEKNGTYIYFIPDKEVFKNGEIGYSFSRICQEIKDISFLYKGLTFSVKNEETDEEKIFTAKNGIIDFVKDEVKKPLHPNIIYATETDGTDTIEIAFQWGVKREKPYTFVNGLHCPENGVNLTGAKSSLTRTFNSLSGKNYDAENIRKNLFYVMNFKIANPSFANQTKSKINSPSARTLASKAFSNALKEMKTKYPQDFGTIVAYLDRIEKAEAAADRAREAILTHESEMAEVKKKKIIDSNKLRDAKKLGKDSILLCVEGLSAGGSMSIGRSKSKEGDYYGILMLRGKCINALANPIEDVLKNEEVKLLLQALGITYGQKYNSKKLRYGKIAICSDADSDGSHIGLLIMAMLQKLCPEIIEEGRLCWLKAPVYKIDNKQKTHYYYTEKDFNSGHEKGDIIKIKGLGQMSQKDLCESMFSKQNQRLETISASPEGIETLLELMGEDVEPRKDFVEQIDFGEIEL